MKFIFTALLLLFSISRLTAQSCPVINGSFATAILFDPNWTMGCMSGTSCNGGTVFDNRTTCKATTTIDACAPTPSCGLPANNASDLWFKFYATANTITITANPGISMKSAIQAFSVNQATPACASLVEIGCNVATGVNSVSLVSLAGLTVGNLYYYRVFGSAPSAAQTTGTFCFCGSAGLANGALAANLSSFFAAAQSHKVNIRWSTSSGSSATSFELERSYDGSRFSIIGIIPANGNPNSNQSYQYTDLGQYANKIFYRLKTNNLTGQPEYSGIIRVNLFSKSKFELQTNLIKQVLKVQAEESLTVQIVNSMGTVYLSKMLKPGLNEINISTFPNGVYFIKNTKAQEMQKFMVQR